MENNSSFVKRILEHPTKLVACVLVIQLILAITVILFAFPKVATHGAQADLSPENALVMKGQRVYFQEGCQYCHTQNLRPFAWELKRFSDSEALGHFPTPDAMEYYFESPALKGSRRLGPDLARAATLYDPFELRRLLKNKGTKKLKDILHQYAYLFEEKDAPDPSSLSLSWKIRFMLQARIPFSDAYQRSVFSTGESSRGDALIAYLLSRGKKHIQFKGKYYRKE